MFKPAKPVSNTISNVLSMIEFSLLISLTFNIIKVYRINIRQYYCFLLSFTNIHKIFFVFV
ncbi:hypothetical protein [Halosquirtibacter xylanolyticus]|uniref:hypothetical protein n=1 Tax=Halosquirtibacter xylanolyticus TaxID=3374599 RepID=UPI00374A332A